MPIDYQKFRQKLLERVRGGMTLTQVAVGQWFDLSRATALVSLIGLGTAVYVAHAVDLIDHDHGYSIFVAVIVTIMVTFGQGLYGGYYDGMR